MIALLWAKCARRKWTRTKRCTTQQFVKQDFHCHHDTLGYGVMNLERLFFVCIAIQMLNLIL